jgi:hypothetical protein
MSTQGSSLSTELLEQIQAFQQEFLPKVPQEIVATLQKTTADLVQSGIAERSLRVGAQMPDFSLPNVRGEQVKLSDLLVRGPAVVAFYRGGW